MNKDDKTVYWALGLTVGTVALGALVYSTVTVVDTNCVGIVTEFGEVVDSLDEGLHFVLPWRNVSQMSCKSQTYSYKSQTYSNDLQPIEVKLNVIYRLEQENAKGVFRTIGTRYIEQVAPRVEDALKQEMARYKAEEIIEKRDVIRSEVIKNSKNKLEKIVKLEDINFLDFDFSKEYEQSIERKLVAYQESLKAEFDLKKSKTIAEQKVALAKGEAEAISVKAQSLRENKDIIVLQAIEKWDGKMPSTLVVGDGAALPMLKERQ